MPSRGLRFRSRRAPPVHLLIRLGQNQALSPSKSAIIIKASVGNSSTAHRSRSAVVSRSCSLPLENGTVLLLARPAERIFSNGVRLEMDLRCRSNIQADFATCHISFVFVFGGGLFRLIMKYMCDTLVLCVGNVMLGFCDSARHHLNHTGLRGGSGNPATRRSPPDSPLIPTQEPLPGAGAGSACCFCSARPPRPGRMERLTP